MAAVPTGFQYFIMWEPNGDKLEFKDSSGGSFCDESTERDCFQRNVLRVGWVVTSYVL